MEQFPLWETNGFSASQKLSAFYGDRKFITILRTVYQLFLFWASWIQPTASSVICLRLILVLFSHLSPGHPCSLLSSYFPTKIRVYFSSVQTTRPGSSISSDLITRIIFCKKYSYKFTKVQENSNRALYRTRYMCFKNVGCELCLRRLVMLWHAALPVQDAWWTN